MPNCQIHHSFQYAHRHHFISKAFSDVIDTNWHEMETFCKQFGVSQGGFGTLFAVYAEEELHVLNAAMNLVGRHIRPFIVFSAFKKVRLILFDADHVNI